MSKTLSFVFSILFYKFKGPELYFLFHGTFPPNKFRSGICSSDSIFICPNTIVLFKGINRLCFFDKRVFVVGISQEVTVMSSPFSNADQSSLREDENFMTISGIIVVFKREL